MASAKESSSFPARRRRVRKKSFTEALREKYCFEEEDTSNFVVKIVVFGKPKNNKDSDAELGHLKNVVLNNSKVACAGLPQTGLSTLCPNVVDLDLSSNFLDSWRETLAILAQLPNLAFINLSNNKLKNDQGYLKDWRHKLGNLENVVLNSTDMAWEDVLTLTTHLPDLKELHVCNNGYSQLPDESLHGLQNVECLRLNNNKIKRWSEIWKLRHLPKLKCLILSGNPLEDVFYSKSETNSCENRTSLGDETKSRETAFAACSTILDELLAEACKKQSSGIDDNRSCQNTNQTDDDKKEFPVDNAQGTNLPMESGNISQKAGVSVEPEYKISSAESMMGDSADHDALHISCCLLDEVISTVCQKTRCSETDNRVISPVQMDVDESQNDCGVCKMRRDLQGAVRITVVNSGHVQRDNFSVVPGQNRCEGCQFMVSKLSGMHTDNSGIPVNGEFKINNGFNANVIEMADASRGHCEEPMDTQSTMSDPCSMPFSQLHTLCLSQTCVSLWEHLYAFSDFPSLKSLRIMGISLVGELPQEEKRKLHMACLPTIDILNGGEVTLTEREKAERHFVRFFIDKVDKPDRYHDLEKKHGKLKPLVDIDLNKGFQEWVTVKFVHHGVEVHQGKIHVLEPVCKLREFVCRTLGEKLGIWGFRMWHLASGPCHEEKETELNELFLDSLPMSRFDIMEGDEIHIEELV